MTQREEAPRCYSSAAEYLKGPEGFRTLPAFINSRWTLAGDQRDDRMRLFGQKLLARLDGMNWPFYPEVGLMELKRARQRYVTGVDPWTPLESPYLDGTAIKFRHVFREHLPPRCAILLAEVAFDVARLAQISVMWGGFSVWREPGLFAIWEGVTPNGWRVDKRTYRCKVGGKIDYDEG